MPRARVKLLFVGYRQHAGIGIQPVHVKASGEKRDHETSGASAEFQYRAVADPIHNLDPGDPELIYCGTFKNFRGSNSRVRL